MSADHLSGGGTVHLSADSDTVMFMLHGYTGSPSDFNDLPDFIHTKLGYEVKIPLLKGHGTVVTDLEGVAHADFYNQLEPEVAAACDLGKRVILLGYSYGGLLATHLASQYPVNGLVVACAPFLQKLPFSIPYLEKVIALKKTFKKPSTHKYHFRTGFYKEMPSYGLQLIKDAKRATRGELWKINCPLLTLNVRGDWITNRQTTTYLENRTNAITKMSDYLTDINFHSLFYHSNKHKALARVYDFLTTPTVVSYAPNANVVSAVIPAFNEAKTIGYVLKTLRSVKLLDEIIVVDDGSSDGTGAVVASHNNVSLLTNSKNVGKYEAMLRGVRHARGNIIFFCDADLQKFDATVVKKLIEPVLQKETEMTIGVRKNLLQNSFAFVQVLSGERVLRKGTWERLPRAFCKGFMVERGLNFVVKKWGSGYTTIKGNYYQTEKELKYGFAIGLYRRLAMYLQVGKAIVVTWLYHLVKK